MEASTTPPSVSATSPEPVRWGVLGTARIARRRVLPALARSARLGRPVAVGRPAWKDFA